MNVCAATRTGPSSSMAMCQTIAAIFSHTRVIGIHKTIITKKKQLVQLLILHSSLLISLLNKHFCLLVQVFYYSISSMFSVSALYLLLFGHACAVVNVACLDLALNCPQIALVVMSDCCHWNWSLTTKVDGSISCYRVDSWCSEHFQFSCSIVFCHPLNEVCLVCSGGALLAPPNKCLSHAPT